MQKRVGRGIKRRSKHGINGCEIQIRCSERVGVAALRTHSGKMSVISCGRLEECRNQIRCNNALFPKGLLNTEAWERKKNMCYKHT